MEHNHEARRAGDYARVPWVGGQAKAVLNFIFATRQILRDWGIQHELVRDGAGGLALMGLPASNTVETNATYALGNLYTGWYVQDQWRIRPKLTINFGVVKLFFFSFFN